MKDAELKEIILEEMAKLKTRLAAAEADVQQFKSELKRRLEEKPKNHPNY